MGYYTPYFTDDCAPRDMHNEWFAVAMNAAAALEDAANCLRDPDAKKSAMGAAEHVRARIRELDSRTAPADKQGGGRTEERKAALDLARNCFDCAVLAKGNSVVSRVLESAGEMLQSLARVAPSVPDALNLLREIRNDDYLSDTHRHRIDRLLAAPQPSERPRGELGLSDEDAREVLRQAEQPAEEASIGPFATADEMFAYIKAEWAAEEALGQAQRLATAIWQSHYRHDAPDWTACDTVAGVLTQIDNMVTGLTRAKPAEEARGVDAFVPRTPEQMIEFMHGHFDSMEAEQWDDAGHPAGDLSRVRYSVTVHDLLSAFDWAGLLAAPAAATAQDYEAVLADHRRLVRELDVLLNGDAAAKQASLCDIVAQVRRGGIKAATGAQGLTPEQIAMVAAPYIRPVQRGMFAQDLAAALAASQPHGGKDRG